MNLRKRLSGKPVQTVLWQIVLIAMALLIGVSATLVYASDRLPEILGKHLTTIAVMPYREEEGEYGSSPQVTLTQDDIDQITRMDMVEMIDLRTLTGAYIPQMSADVALANWGTLHAMNYDYINDRHLNDCYNQVVVTGTVEQSWTVDEEISTHDISVIGHGTKVPGRYAYAILNVEEILVMNDEYDIFETEEYSSYCGKAFVSATIYDELDVPFFQEGERYIVSGSYDPSAYGLTTTVQHTPGDVFLPWIKVTRPYLATCVIQDDTLLIYKETEEDFPLTDEYPYHTTILKAEDPFPVVQKLDGSLEDFLAENSAWSERIELLEMAQHTFPVLGTQCLESMQYFVTNSATITDGRSFTQEEYDTGAKVLILNEALAQEAGIKVGDTISLSQYYVGETYKEGNWKETGFDEANDPFVGVKPIPYGLETENESFTVVGLYRLERSWQDNAFSFTPNTIFMPQNAQIEGGYGGVSEIVKNTIWGRQTDLETGEVTWEGWMDNEELQARGSYGVYMSVKIENGKMEEFLEAIGNSSLKERKFLTFDQGYEQMEASIDAVIAAAKKLFSLALAGWGLLLLLYILLYQSREKRNLGVMRSVGAKPAQARRYLFSSGMLLAAIGAVVGTALSGTVARLVQDKLVSLTLTQAESIAHSGGVELDNSVLAQMLSQSEISFTGILILIGLQISIIAILLWLNAAWLAKKKTRKLLGV